MKEIVMPLEGTFAILEESVIDWLQFSSVHFSRSVVSDSLQPQESQHARPPCPSPSPGVNSNSCLSSQYRYDLNQIPYDYTVEVRNRSKGIDLIDRVPDELWTEVHDIVQETGIKTIPMEKQNVCLWKPCK